MMAFAYSMYTCILNLAMVNMSQFTIEADAHLVPLHLRFYTPTENCLDSWLSVALLLQHRSSPRCQLSKRRFVGASCGGVGADEETIDHNTPNRHTLRERLHGMILSLALCTLGSRMCAPNVWVWVCRIASVTHMQISIPVVNK
jgi:hypothetical protein